MTTGKVLVPWAEKEASAPEARFQTFVPSQCQFKKLDVRPALMRGEEPYPEIRRRVAALKADEGLMVIAPFLPAPLIEKLGSEGFRSRVERGGDGSWVTYFWREAA